MARVMHESVYYLDKIGYDVKYYLGGRDLTVAWQGEIYHCFNGLMLMAVL